MSSASVTPQASPLATRLISINPSNAEPCNNVTGTTGRFYMVDIDNIGNPTAASYVKFYDHLNPSVGTTAPEWCFKIDAGVRRQYVIPEGMAYAIGLSVATVTTPGTAGTVAPTSTVKVWIATS